MLNDNLRAELLSKDSSVRSEETKRVIVRENCGYALHVLLNLNEINGRTNPRLGNELLLISLKIVQIKPPRNEHYSADAQPWG